MIVNRLTAFDFLNSLLIGLCLKDYQQSTLRQLGDYIKSNQLFTKK